MNEPQRRLYSLVYVPEKGESIVIKLKDDSGKLRERSFLTDLDDFTTSFENTKSLLDTLVQAGIISNADNSNEMLRGSFEIQYKNSGRIKVLRVVFGKDEISEDLNKFSSKESEQTENAISDLFFKLIDIRMNEHEKYKYLCDTRCISDNLSYLIGDYMHYTGRTEDDYHNTYEARETRKIIINELSSYKVYRDIVVGIDDYHHAKERKHSNETDSELNKKVAELIEIKRPAEVTESDFGQHRLPGFEYMDNESGQNKKR